MGMAGIWLACVVPWRG